jgi:CDP-glycerol glycerophosphotransferase
VKIVFQSFEGRYSDSPRALYEGLLRRRGSHDCLWLVDARHAQTFPPRAVTVPYRSADCVSALESADLVIANTHTDMEWTKRPGALYLQTWHGTPLKRIHFDVLWSPPGLTERLSRDVARWDVLLSPNRVSTERLRRAFGFGGEVLESGYPRNDVLNSPVAATLRARVRSELDITPHRTAVLYAPTWRDDERHVGGKEASPGAGGGETTLGLDVAAFAKRLGENHVLLLRLHPLLTGRLQAYEHPAVRDVSLHADVSELYLAADVLVTDYSSSMFDFAVTGKPLVFYMYDRERYESRTRGVYFDLSPLAPGPIVETTADLLDALEELPGATARYAARYARFRDAFCHLDDGHATERVLDRALSRPPRRQALS